MSLILKMTCPDQPGLVADLTARMLEFRCNILESNQFFQPAPGTQVDDGDGSFFMRVVLSTPVDVNMDALESSIEAFGEKFGADISLKPADEPVKTILMVSKFDHCLQDILYRVQKGALNLDIVAVVSNHADSRNMAERLGIPFYLWPVTKENKLEQEDKMNELVERTGAELIVLARYMQILSDGFSRKHFGKIINIHHSFLPAFKGAKPYHRAWERGVKLIGATAHYVTPDLDEGPIIEQDTERVNHTDDAEELVRRGRDIEARVLSRALRFHAEGRTFIDGNRTVVFHK